MSELRKLYQIDSPESLKETVSQLSAYVESSNSKTLADSVISCLVPDGKIRDHSISDLFEFYLSLGIENSKLDQQIKLLRSNRSEILQ